MTTYMGMNAYTFMPIIGIYASMGIYYVGISFKPIIGIFPYIGIYAYMSINALKGINAHMGIK